MNIDELRAFLISHNIPLHKWGTGEAKTIEHLLTELNEGETILEETGGTITRLINVCMLEVYFDGPNGKQRIMEEKQVFVDGRTRVRDYMAGGVFEKMKPGEKPENAAWRALREELSINEQIPLIQKPNTQKGPVLSESFPGIACIFKFFNFDVYLTEEHYRAQGYVEIQKDKSTYFIWQNC